MLAKDMIAGFDNPPFDRSPVDGYACKEEDITDASESHPVQLTVLEEIDAGQYSRVTVEKGQAVRIMTGAAIPKGCDSGGYRLWRRDCQNLPSDRTVAELLLSGREF